MHKMDYVLITCNVTNAASERTCQIAGGVLIDTAEVPEDSDLREQGITEVKIYKFPLTETEGYFSRHSHDLANSTSKKCQ